MLAGDTKVATAILFDSWDISLQPTLFHLPKDKESNGDQITHRYSDVLSANFMIPGHPDPRAHRGDLLMVGGQRPDGTIPQDRGRINAVRLRGTTAADYERSSTDEPLRRRVAPDVKRRVVYSLRLDGLVEGEQLDVHASTRVDISHLRYAVRSSARVILAEAPRDVRQSDFVKAHAHHRGEISENNGSNCTQDEGTCVAHKVGVVEMRRSALDAAGRPVPLYINVVTVFGPKVREARGDDRVLLRGRAGIDVTRFPAELNR